ncbi:MAG: hypothetical protein U0871_11670 [Gemmataceae bacterium]
MARLRAVQKQIAFRKELLKDNTDAKDLLKASEELGHKLTALEEKLHNPKAKVSYDIFAARGGAMLYSQLVWLLALVCDGDGPPNAAQTRYAEEYGKQLAGLIAEFDKLMKEDVARLNDQAAKLGVPGVFVPAAKK